MGIEFFQSKSGALTAKLGTILIHSAYDPVKEAQRFLESKIKTPPSTVILIGSGLQYLDELILTDYPQAMVLSLHTTDLADKNRQDKISSTQLHCWSMQHPLSLQQFLAQKLSEINLDGLEVVIWSPMIQADEKYTQILKSLKSFIQRLESSFYSLSQFGWRWLNNIISNYLSCEENLQLPKVQDIVIAASGPSLRYAITSLKKYRKNYYLIALPSSLCCLSQHNIIPDLLVMTDGGYYAKRHLQYLPKTVPIAMPMVASYNYDHPKFIFSFHTFFEQWIFQDEKYPVPIFAWNGTVAGNALVLAQTISGGKIILIGQDFCAEGLHLHAFPHTFAPIYDEQSTRCQPLVSFYQKAIWESRPSLDIYATWFKDCTSSKNIYRFSPSSVDLPFAEFKLKDFDQLKSSITPQKVVMLTPRKERQKKIGHLINWLRGLAENLDALTPEQEEILLYFDAIKYHQYKKALRVSEDEQRRKEIFYDKLIQKIDFLDAKYYT
ncbi:MAG: 6-hydroxymethylpterin diphosphokinase MptE-like protein [Spirochaetia bacterium]